MLTIIRKEFQVMLKEKGTFFWLIILPIIFILIFAAVFKNTDQSNLKIHYIDKDKSAAAQTLLTNLKNIKGFELVNDNNLSEAEQIKKIKDGKLSSLLVIPAGFERELSQGTNKATLDFYRDATADSTVQPIRVVLENLSSGYREGKIVGALKATGRSNNEVTGILQSPLKINEIRENAKKINIINQIIPGYTVMFVFFIMITMTRNFVKDKESGMLARLRSTPMKPLNYLTGMWVTNIIVVLIQCTVLISFGHFAYKLNLGDIKAIAFIIISLAICGTGLGLALSLLVKSENQGVAVTQIITMGGAALGGLWVPFDLMPPLMQTIGHFTPQYWAQKGFQDVMIRGAHLGDIWGVIVVLLAFGVVGLVVALARYKRFIVEAAN